jgi:hypothetical protein
MLALGNELVGAAGVAEVEQALPRVNSQVCFRHPGAPCWPVGSGIVEVFLGRCEGAQHGAPFPEVASRREGPGEAQLEKAAGGGVAGAGQGVVEDAGCGGVITLPGGLVGEVAQEAGTQVVVAGGVGVVQGGYPVLAGVGVVAQVEAVPGRDYLDLPGDLAGESAV